MPVSRRDFLSLSTGAATGLSLLPGLSVASASQPAWRRSAEGHRQADLGDGTYLNPVLAGDYPDPTILRDGDDYYMTHSSFDAAPGILIWHSKDLVNWQPVGPALEEPLGIVFAMDLVKHNGRYYIYIPFMKAPWSPPLASFANIMVIHADNIEGPWSEPVDLHLGGVIDPGHIVDEKGQRWLFTSGIKRIRLADDGLSTIGELEQVYDGWQYPDDWITEAYALEGPKLFRRGDYFYLVSAVGGTAGPATGHMVIVARFKTIDGPWENCPHNPIVRTESEDEKWWSRGHATMLEGPQGKWYMVYHGYENGFRTLGRQTLVEPMGWDDDNWPVALGGDLSLPLPKPEGEIVPHGFTHSDNFTSSSLGTRWTFFGAAASEKSRVTYTRDGLKLKAAGSFPTDSAPLVQTIGDQAYEISVIVNLEVGTEAGLLLFYNNRLYLGMGQSESGMVTYRGGKSSYWREPAPQTRRLHMKIRNDRHIVTFYYSKDGKNWTRHTVRSETSGYNVNTIDDLQGLKPALFACGKGSATFSQFTYRGLK
ncbi:MAG: family 43 glycosylhydrolase [Pseudomonadota bacterium]|nr:family 43 glycosylhydrolase [Pseudomonadota bacterium]